MYCFYKIALDPLPLTGTMECFLQNNTSREKNEEPVLVTPVCYHPLISLVKRADTVSVTLY